MGDWNAEARTTADKYDTNPFAAQRAAKGSKTVRRQRCGDCTGCKAIDCGKCKNCMNMKKFGGTLNGWTS